MPGFGNQTGGKLLHYAFDPGDNSRLQVLWSYLKPQKGKRKETTTTKLCSDFYIEENNSAWYHPTVYVGCLSKKAIKKLKSLLNSGMQQ